MCKKCCLDENDICMGCFRSLDDMKQWHKASRSEKEKVLSLAKQRKKEHQKQYPSFGSL